MDNQFLYDAVEAAKKTVTDLSDAIWGYAELSMEEYKSAAAYCDILEKEGFQVTRQLCGLPTAFSGSFGTEKPVIGILGEFDALSGLSQQPGSAEHVPLVEGGCGHGCGHNLLGAGPWGLPLP